MEGEKILYEIELCALTGYTLSGLSWSRLFVLFCLFVKGATFFLFFEELEMTVI